ncbi:MAG: SDR family oxidoreductase [Alphaproteobacteria bacterium]|nr:SDR family oxidoreductase [Alphaproteobacteria bacterium]
MISADLTGKTMLVTGAASGIGLATAELFARCGARVAINYLPDDPRGPDEVGRLESIGHQVVAAPGDVGQPKDAKRIVKAALDGLGGRLDYLVNNAGTPGGTGVFDYADLSLMTDEFWQTLMQVNLVGMFRMVRESEKALRKSQGAIVNVASIAGLGVRGSSSVYAATKAGVVNLTISLARGLAPDVRVNAVAPGLVDSPWTKKWPKARKEKGVARAMLRRMAKPEDLAEAILYLCAGGSFVTAHTLVVDGGMMHGD